MCPYPTPHRRRDRVAEVHKLIVDKVKAWGAPISMITHAGMGEPLTDRGIHDKIAYERRASFRAHGLRSTPMPARSTDNRVQQLFDARLDVLSVSLNAFSKEDLRDRDEAAVRAHVEQPAPLPGACNEARGKPIEFHVSLIPTEHHSEEEIANFRSYWGPRAHNVIVPPRISWGGF